MLLPWHLLIHRHMSVVTKLNSLKWLKRQCVRAVHIFRTTNLSLQREIITNKSRCCSLTVNVGTKKFARFLASVAMYLWPSFFRDFAGRRLVLDNRCTGAPYRFQLQGSSSSILDCLTFEDGTSIFSRSVFKQLPTYAAQNQVREKGF
jgi:hypothetical protein